MPCAAPTTATPTTSTSTGGFGQSFGPTRREGYYGLDHRAEDAWGPSFDTAVLREPRPRGEEADGMDRVSAYERTHDVARGEHTAHFTLGDDQIWCRVKEDDPATASLELKGVEVDEAQGRSIEGRAEGSLRSTEAEFAVDIECSLVQDGTVVRSRRWQHRVKRELV